MVGHEQREAAPRRINRRMLLVRNWRPQSSSFWLDGRHSEAIQDWPFRTDSPLPNRLGGETAASPALPLVSVHVAQLRCELTVKGDSKKSDRKSTRLNSSHTVIS